MQCFKIFLEIPSYPDEFIVLRDFMVFSTPTLVMGIIFIQFYQNKLQLVIAEPYKH